MSDAQPSHYDDLQQTVRTSFWAVCYPTLESTLMVVPSMIERGASAVPPQSTGFDVFDCDGELVNEVRVQLPANELGVLELAPFMEGCKLDSGFKHGRLSVHSDFPCRHLMRIHGRDSAVLCGGLLTLSAQQPLALPVLADQKRSTMLVLANTGSSEAAVRLKLYVATRSPEVRCTVPPGASRLLLLGEEFAECLQGENAKTGRGYVKATVSEGAALGVQLVERVMRTPETESLRAVC